MLKVKCNELQGSIADLNSMYQALIVLNILKLFAF